MRRVLHVNDYPPDEGGGAEVLMARTCRLLEEAGWQVRTFTRADLPDARRTPLRYLHNHVARTALRAILGDFRPDVVHLHNYYHQLSPAILIDLDRYKRQSAARVMMTAHDFHLVCPNSGCTWYRGHEPNSADLDRLSKWPYLLSRRWDRRGWAYSALKVAQHAWNYRRQDCRRAIDLVICPSRFLMHAVAQANRPVVWLPYPNPPSGLAAVTRPAVLTLVFAGRIEPEKGLARFLEMLPADFEGRFVVIGEGDERPAAEAMARARGMAQRVNFLGRLPHAETLDRIAAAHVLVLPSRWDENYPLSMLEALAAGTNLLVANRGGMREIVEDARVGYRFTPDDPINLAAQLREISAAYAAGALNSFDAQTVLSGRDESAHLAALLRAYAGEPVGER